MSCASSCCRKNTFTYANICCENPGPEWKDFTPVIEDVTLSNNSSLTGRYIVINKTVYYTVSLLQTGNATSSLSPSFTISTPVPAAFPSFTHVGTGIFVSEESSVQSSGSLLIELLDSNTFQLFSTDATLNPQPALIQVEYLTDTDSIRLQFSGFYEAL